MVTTPRNVVLVELVGVWAMGYHPWGVLQRWSLWVSRRRVAGYNMVGAWATFD